MSETAKQAIQAYLRLERPEYHGEGSEPPLLTESGTIFTPSGWNQIQRRFRVACARERIALRQHRLRPPRAKEASRGRLDCQRHHGSPRLEISGDAPRLRRPGERHAPQVVA